MITLHHTAAAETGNTALNGKVSGQAGVELLLNGEVVYTINLKPDATKKYFVTSGFRLIGEANFKIGNYSRYNQISLNFTGGWFVVVSPGHRTVPTVMGSLFFKTHFVKQKHIIK